MTINTSIPIANIGLSAFLSEYNTTAVTADFLGDIASISGLGFSVEMADGTSLTDLWKRLVPTIRENKPFTLTLFVTTETATLVELMVSESNDALYKRVTFSFPETTYNTGLPDIAFDGVISNLDIDQVDVGSLQRIVVTLTPDCAPALVTAPARPTPTTPAG